MTATPAPKTPATPAPKAPDPIEIIELVDVTNTTALLIMLGIGLVVGIGVYWLLTHVMVEDDHA